MRLSSSLRITAFLYCENVSSETHFVFKRSCLLSLLHGIGDVFGYFSFNSRRLQKSSTDLVIVRWLGLECSGIRALQTDKAPTSNIHLTRLYGTLGHCDSGLPFNHHQQTLALLKKFSNQRKRGLRLYRCGYWRLSTCIAWSGPLL